MCAGDAAVNITKAVKYTNNLIALDLIGRYLIALDLAAAFESFALADVSLSRFLIFGPGPCRFRCRIVYCVHLISLSSFLMILWFQ